MIPEPEVNRLNDTNSQKGPLKQMERHPPDDTMQGWQGAGAKNKPLMLHPVRTVPGTTGPSAAGKGCSSGGWLIKLAAQGAGGETGEEKSCPQYSDPRASPPAWQMLGGPQMPAGREIASYP